MHAGLILVEGQQLEGAECRGERLSEGTADAQQGRAGTSIVVKDDRQDGGLEFDDALLVHELEKVESRRRVEPLLVEAAEADDACAILLEIRSEVAETEVLAALVKALRGGRVILHEEEVGRADGRDSQ